MSNVGFATLSVIPSLKGIDRSLQSQVTGPAAAAGRHAGKEAGSNFANALSSEVRGAGSKIRGAVGGAMKGIGKVGAIAFAGIGAAAIGAGALGLKVASDMEQARISFETMLGSAKKADVFLKQLQAFAAKTPFEFPELQSAASSLISVGIDASKVIPIMTTLGDVTSGMGTGAEGVKRATIALQQMSAAGRITGEDLNQLRDAGIPVFDLLAAATGKSKAEVVKLAQAGKLGAAELAQLMKALETGKGLERFSGLMEKQSQSLAGMISTLKDTLGQGLARAVTPLVSLAKDVIPKLVGPLGDLLDTFSEAATSVLPLFAGILESLMPAIQPIASVLATLADRLAKALLPVLSKLAPFIGEMAEAFGDVLVALVPLIPPIGELLAVLIPIIPALTRLIALFVRLAVAALVPIFSLLAKNKGLLIGIAVAIGTIFVPALIAWAISAASAAAATIILWAPIIAIGIAVGALVVGVLWLVKNWSKAWKAIVGVAKTVGRVITGVVGAIIDFFKELPGKVLGFARRFLPIILAVLFPPAALVAAIIKFWGPISRFFKELPGRILGTISQGLQVLIAGIIVIGIRVIQALIKGFVAEVKFVIDFWRKLPGRILTALGAIGRFLLGAGRALLSGLLKGAVAYVRFVLDFWRKLPSRILHALGAIATFLFSAGGKLLRGLRDGAIAFLTTLLTWFTRLPHRIVGAIGDVGNLLLNIGKAILRSLINGAKAVLGEVKDFFVGIGKKITSWKGPLDADRRMLTPAGRAIMQSLIDGVAAEENRLKALLGRISGHFESFAPRVATPTLALQSSSPRLSAAEVARGARAGGSSGSIVNLNVQVNNPKPEPTSSSLPVALRHAKIKLRRS